MAICSELEMATLSADVKIETIVLAEFYIDCPPTVLLVLVDATRGGAFDTRRRISAHINRN